MMATRKVFWHLHAGLLDRLERVAEEQGRAPRKVVEHALAKYLAVPLANRELPEQPVEMCPACERGVLHDGACRECGWHREPRPWHRRTRARDTKRRAVKARKLRLERRRLWPCSHPRSSVAWLPANSRSGLPSVESYGLSSLGPAHWARAISEQLVPLPDGTSTSRLPGLARPGRLPADSAGRARPCG